jgi:ribosomal protein S18
VIPRISRMLASRRLWAPSALLRLSALSISNKQICPVRCFSGKDDDPFGVNYNDGEGNIGPSDDLPPKFVRDTATGKLTGVVEQTLSEKQRKLLEMDDMDSQKKMLDDLVEAWVHSEKDKIGDPVKQAEFASRVREERMALNVFGRSPEATSLQGKLDNGDDAFDSDLSSDLSPREFNSLQKYMAREKGYELQRGHDDVPITVSPYRETGYANPDPDLDLKWLTSGAQRELEGGKADDPFADLMPHDLNPARLVNRKKAKLLPTELIHHNNIVLLRRYTTPGGQIMNRVQSRLGAKDQRKISKLVKRARAMGLIPHIGQWKVENHGSIYDEDIFIKRPWEEELENRGLLPPKVKDADWESMKKEAKFKYQREAKKFVGPKDNPWEEEPWCTLSNDVYRTMKAKGMRLTKQNNVYAVCGNSHFKLGGNGKVAMIDTTGVIADGTFEVTKDGVVSFVWDKAIKWDDDQWSNYSTAGLVSGFKFGDEAVTKSTHHHSKVIGKEKVHPLDVLKAKEFSDYVIEWGKNDLRKRTDVE